MTKVKRNAVLATAKKELGTGETPPGSNMNKYGAWYGLNGVAWCAEFVSWVFDKAGTPLGKIDDAKGYRYCPSAYNFWKATGQITKTPQGGDIVLFDWNGDGMCDHTGIFVKDNGNGTFTAYEGNTSNSNQSNGGLVMERVRYYAAVRAFVSPKCYSDGTPVPAPVEYKKGDLGAGVADFQGKLQKLGYDITIDGEFGPQTEKVVKAFETDNGLASTGKVTPVSIGIMDELLRLKQAAAGQITTGSFLNPGSSGMPVRLLQEALNAKGAKPKISADGSYGPMTKKAVEDFQRANKLEVDGIAGPMTLKKLGLVV